MSTTRPIVCRREAVRHALICPLIFLASIPVNPLGHTAPYMNTRLFCGLLSLLFSKSQVLGTAGKG
jgi:hypothetical protein